MSTNTIARSTRARMPRRRWYRRPGVLLALFLPVLAAGSAGAAVFVSLFSSIPLPSDLGTGATVVVDVHGEKIGELTEHAGREDVRLVDVPEHTRNAVLAAEDAHFYRHHGVSVPGVARAVMANVASGEVRQGGSTISQQYVKNFTGDTERTALRKIREAILAVKLERRYTKDEIFELYLNTIYFGRGAYGIEAASRAYFDKPVTQLSIAESAQLAGLLPAPSALDPGENPDRAHERYRYVLTRMVEEGWLAADEAGRLADVPPAVVDRKPTAAQQAPYFMALLEQQLVRALEGRAYRGLTVTATLDLRMQRAAEEEYAARFAALAEESDGDTVPTGALVSLDPRSGGIRAMVGGPDHATDQFNLATGGPEGRGRQPGSTFKTFALAAHIEQGRSPETVFDAPATLELSAEESGNPGGWSPSNYGGRGFGQMTLREATERSVNTVYAQLALDVGPEAIVRVAQEAGIRHQLAPQPSIVLGSQEVTPLELAAAYNTFAAGGVRRDPHTIVTAEHDGQVLYRPNPRERRVFSEQVAWNVADVLRGVIERGTGTAAAIGRPAAGKTGTTDDSSDAWFAGYTPDLTTVVWMGNRDNNEPMADAPTGGGFPAVLWGGFMTAALEGTEPADFPAPSGDLEVARTFAPIEEATTEAPTEPACPEGQTPAEGEAGAQPDGVFAGATECVDVSPTGDPVTETPTASPTPDVSEPPTTQPPATQPPATEPPATEPPAPPEPTASPLPEPTGGGDPTPGTQQGGTDADAEGAPAAADAVEGASVAAG